VLPTPVILAVSHNPRNLDLLRRVVGTAGYQLLPAVSLAAFERALAHPEAVRLALVDITGFDARIWDLQKGRCDVTRYAPHRTGKVRMAIS
jgi:hypothetical protein